MGGGERPNFIHHRPRPEQTETSRGSREPFGRHGEEYRRSEEEYRRFHESYVRSLERTHAQTDEVVPPPAEVTQEARQEIMAMMREARPHSWQARAIAHVVRWYGVVLHQEHELLGDYYERRYRQKGRIEAIMERNSERSPEYEAERDFAMLLIEGYAAARLAELKQHGVTPAPDNLQELVARELKAMKTLAKRGESTVIFTPPENPRP